MPRTTRIAHACKYLRVSVRHATSFQAQLTAKDAELAAKDAKIALLLGKINALPSAAAAGTQWNLTVRINRHMRAAFLCVHLFAHPIELF